ncbi:hypothetical protein AVT69_gp171 [Pseudomonas phage PhiPA3]|uniref:Uncharacterized protein 173 n=1 Tax=Pseudomonas phage PhiPA3 TaxID=998086 RepID=F8SK46_BPPA3|nr:hypothetical protein AVT69_gp171 [Pseudomonas phage PhiPA3]AEH03596.1 hypothetical protein [Pseudomonas phage PhiPA3]
MNAVVDLKMMVIQRIRAFDVELSEDLYRRMPAIGTLEQLNQYFQLLLASYAQSTLELRTLLNANDPLEVWCANFQKKVLPFLSKHRLPPCTDSRATAMYQCESKPI